MRVCAAKATNQDYGTGKPYCLGWAGSSTSCMGVIARASMWDKLRVVNGGGYQTHLKMRLGAEKKKVRWLIDYIDGQGEAIFQSLKQQ